jgi:hypothetical protein
MGGGLGKLHGEPTGAEIMPELLPEQHFDIRLIVNEGDFSKRKVLN